MLCVNGRERERERDLRWFGGDIADDVLKAVDYSRDLIG